MRKFLYTGAGLAILGGIAFAQSVGWPPPAGMLAALGVYNSGGITLTNTQVSPVQLDSAGNLKVNIASGGSGGGAITVADGADVTQGAIADAASTAGGTGTLSAKLRLMTTQLGTINTTLGSPFQAGGALGAGSAIIGNVRIDQTTPGTTNGVQVNAALPAGTNNIGTVDQTGKTTTMATSAPTAATFAALLASSASRKACLIQNTGTTLGYVYFGATGSATTGNAFQLVAGQSISCTNGNITVTDNVAGTCASGTCAFIISSQ